MKENYVEVLNNTLYLCGIIEKQTIPLINREITGKLDLVFDSVDFSKLKSIDSAGVSFLDVILKNNNKKEDLQLHNITESLVLTFKTFSNFYSVINEADKYFFRFNVSKEEEFLPQAKVAFFEKFGNTTTYLAEKAMSYLYLSADIFYWSLIGLINKKGARKGSFYQQGNLIGMDAVPVITFLSFIIGLILALQSAAQLRQFGANIFVADLIAISMVREMGPLMTAIIVAGRSGSAIASEIATMKVTEELDALKMMAINPVRYVIVPKIHAITVCMPLLVTISIIVGILGGLVIAVTYLDLSAVSYYNQVVNVLFLKDIIVSFIKSMFFAWTIVIIGSYYGLQVKGGAEGVGKATTLSVVASIFAVIILDVIFSLLFLPK